MAKNALKGNKTYIAYKKNILIPTHSNIKILYIIYTDGAKIS